MAKDSGSNHTLTEEMRIVMVGKSGAGKSATGNTILGPKHFFSKPSSTSVTEDCSKRSGVISGQRVSVTDTPGFFDTRYGKEKTAADVTQCISYACPGPHVFLVVIKVGRYTAEEKKTVQEIQEIFGQAADKYSMVLFTGGDDLDGFSIKDFIDESKDLQELVARCHHQYHVFNNKIKDPSQVTELFQKIRNIVEKNGGSHYTNEMFKEAERLVKEEEDRILKEKEKEIRREQEKVEKKVKAEFDKQIQEIKKQIQEEKERERKERKREREEMNEERKREREEMNKERKREREEMNEQRKREREEMDEERKREREEMKEERKREGKERAAEIRRESEEREREMARVTEMYERELSERRNDVEIRYATQARQEAEDLNPLLPIVRVAEGVVGGVKAVGNLFGRLLQ